MRKGIKKVPFSHVIDTFFVFSLVSGEVESCLVGKSGREIWISVFAMMISCPELVKIKRGNKIKEVRSGVVGTPTGVVGVCNGANVITTGRVGALSRADGIDGGTVGARSGANGTDSGRVGARSKTDGMDGGRVGARSWMICIVSWMKSMVSRRMGMASRRMGTTSWMMSMASRMMGTAGGTMGMRSERYVVRSGVAMRAAVG